MTQPDLPNQPAADTQTNDTPSPQWCYVLYGQKNGPIEHEQMLSLIASGVIKPTTSVWCGGDTWLAAQDTQLSPLFVQPTRHEPPALAAQDIDNRYVWMVVAVPIVGALIELIAGESLFWVYWIFNIGLCVLDERKLSQAGHLAPNKKWSLLVPAYLWKRADILGQSKQYVWAWIATWLLSMVLAYSMGNKALETAACSTVTDILYENYPYRHVTCKAVDIDKEVSDGFYRATAVLSNGNEADITIEKTKKGSIYVQIRN
jgi:hypothetical protein